MPHSAKAVGVNFLVSVKARYGGLHWGGRAHDLSSRGMLLQLDGFNLNVGELIEISFKPTNTKIQVLGKVVSSVTDRAPQYLYGVKFVSMYKPDRIALRDTLQTLRS